MPFDLVLAPRCPLELSYTTLYPKRELVQSHRSVQLKVPFDELIELLLGEVNRVGRKADAFQPTCLDVTE